MEAGDQVKHRGLARSVGSDEPHDLACLHAEVEVAHGEEAAEALGQSGQLEKAHGRPARARRSRTTPMMPWGRKEITSTRMAPYSMMSAPARPRSAERVSSERGVSTNDPRTGPRTVPAPPTMAGRRAPMDTLGPKVMVGSM